jgi:hypothetical protein
MQCPLSPEQEALCERHWRRATHFLGVVHVAHWRAGARVHHTVHGKVRTYQIAITRYFDLVALHPVFLRVAQVVHRSLVRAPVPRREA